VIFVHLKRIKYKNYRPFVNTEIKFNHERGITLIIGENGSGKSEILLSILWALYGEDDGLFRFENLKGKNMVPFSLNDELYKKVDKAIIKSATASVELEFYHKDKTYTLIREEVFSKPNRKVEKQTKLKLFFVEENGTSSIPIKNEIIVKREIEQILPMYIAKALFFDGEKMMNLTSETKRKDEIIQIIKTVADLDLVDSLESHLKKAQLPAERRYKKNLPSDDDKRLYQSIVYLQSERESVKIDLEKYQELLDNEIDIRDRFYALADEIDRKEKQRDKLSRLKERRKNKLESYEETNKNLNNILSARGYLFFTGSLFRDLNTFIENVEIPLGIDSNLVEFLLQKQFLEGNCICGRSIDKRAEEFMRSLAKKLPPDFKPAEIKNQIYEMKEIIEDALNQINRFNEKKINLNDQLKSIDDEIKLLNERVSELSISDKKTRERFRKANELIPEYDNKIKKIEKQLTDINQNIKKQEAALEKKEIKEIEYQLAKRELDLYNKYIDFCNIIVETEKEHALRDINRFFKDAFAAISGDLEEQFEVEINDRYEIVKYTEKYGNKEIKSSSTGQLKVLAMSFIKAITDFAMKVANDDILREQKQYPVIIDAAFGDISGDNLTGVTQQLCNFDSQLIVLVAKDQLNTFKKNIEKDVVQEIYIIRDKQQGISEVRW